MSTFKIPPSPGVVPCFGDVLNSRHVYVCEVGGGWFVRVHANNDDEAARIVESQGYSVRWILIAD